MSGIQVCKADGSGFDACTCEPGAGGSGGSGGADGAGGSGGADGAGGAMACAPGSTASCYTGPQGSENVGACKAGVKACNDQGTGYGACTGEVLPSPEICGSGIDEDCDGAPGAQVYAGLAPNIAVPWQYQGLVGIDAGMGMCGALGADHPCTYEEIKEAEMLGELASIPSGTTAWLHRTTAVTVDGQMYPPGAGGRCNDWLYDKNDYSDGEYLVINSGSATYFFDDDPIFDVTTTAHTLPAQLECGGVMRAVLCCSAALCPL